MVNCSRTYPTCDDRNSVAHVQALVNNGNAVRSSSASLQNIENILK